MSERFEKQRRRGDPDTTYRTTDPSGDAVRLRSNSEGIVEVTNEAELRLADAKHLSTIREPKASKE